MISRLLEDHRGERQMATGDVKKRQKFASVGIEPMSYSLLEGQRQWTRERCMKHNLDWSGIKHVISSVER